MSSDLSRTLANQVAERLRDQVRTGALKPGELLPPLHELAAKFNVARSTVREAVQFLTSVGVLESRSGVGTWVRPDAEQVLIHPAAVRARLGEQDPRSLAKARWVIEVALTEMAASEALPEEIQAIYEALETMERARDDEWVSADLRFHLAVAGAGHNELLAQFYRVAQKLLAEIITDQMAVGVRPGAERIQRAIADAIAAHDPGAARRAAEEHQAWFSRLVNSEGAQEADEA